MGTVPLAAAKGCRDLLAADVDDLADQSAGDNRADPYASVSGVPVTVSA
jgi:hypothetical protein